MANKGFIGTKFSAFGEISSRSVIVLGGRAFTSKSEKECYVLDILSKHKVESVFVDDIVYATVYENGSGEYNVFRDDRGRIEDIEFVATFSDCLA